MNPDPLKEKEKIQRLVDRSKTYSEILEHRKSCKKWGLRYCEDCFGGGLHKFLMKLYFKDRIRFQ